jgi:hypothetical protein
MLNPSLRTSQKKLLSLSPSALEPLIQKSVFFTPIAHPLLSTEQIRRILQRAEQRFEQERSRHGESYAHVALIQSLNQEVGLREATPIVRRFLEELSVWKTDGSPPSLEESGDAVLSRRGGSLRQSTTLRPSFRGKRMATSLKRAE